MLRHNNRQKNDIMRSLFARIVVNAILCAVLSAAVPSYAALPDQDSQTFSFYFSVIGYGRATSFGEPSALALDRDNSLIFIADVKAGNVNAFGFQGVSKFQYGAKNGLKAPVGLAVGKNDNLFISEDEGGPVKIIDSKGEVSALALPGAEGEEAPKPGRMTVDQDGNLYVVDRTNCRVYVFDKERKFKFKLGGVGNQRGEFKMLQDVAVDRQGRIYALDTLGTPVQVFDKNGKFIYRFGSLGEGVQDVSFPAALFIDRHDQIWIVDKAQHCLKVFGRSGAFLRKFGDYGLGESTLFYPIDADIDDFGRVYVLEVGARRLQVFSLKRPFEPLRPEGF